MKIHEKYINRCIDIAKNGLGTTRPNPMVGCVIVHEGSIVGEGFTSPYGGLHAEVNAIASVRDKSTLASSTLYVTLEPCSHHGKTPPCADLILEHGIPRVVIGTGDPSDKVAGRGVRKLQEGGCEVITGVLEAECRELHKRFMTYHHKKRPYIILKWAQTPGGYMAPEERQAIAPVWITKPPARQLVHKWRSEEQAILIGTNTVLMDDPSLTTRLWTGNNPIRVVIDKENKLSKSHRVFDDKAETIVISEEHIDFKKPVAAQICEQLHNAKINSVLVEGGSRTLQTFINEGLWDEARIFTGTNEFEAGVEAPVLEGVLRTEQLIGDDLLKIYRYD